MLISRVFALLLYSAIRSEAASSAWRVAGGGSCSGEETRYVDCGNSACATECQPVNCKLGAWHAFGACTCEGLKDRNRQVAVHNNECGTPCNASLTETQSCKTDCLHDSTDCVMGSWGAWADCARGQTQTSRSRTVTSKATYGGQGCKASTTETKPCPPPQTTQDKDCAWGTWSEWSACTCTCNGGQKTRDRSVQQAPRGKGTHCLAKTKTEISPCNTQSCSSPCKDGSWAEWENWEQCTATCGGGTRWRKRSRGIEANHCGKPAIGKDSEAESCNTGTCSDSVDCLFSDWNEWSACSCSCEGIQTAHRSIQQYGRGDGKWCIGPLKILRACNNYTDPSIQDCSPEGAEPQDCQLSDWTSLGECSTTCGGGQQTQTRNIQQVAKNGGKPCSANLQKTQPCNTQPCKVQRSIPCQWGPWSTWGACDKCGGQQKRSRNIKVMPKHGGTPCVFEASEETKKCPRHCHSVRFTCEWSDWASEGDCTVTCGPGFKEYRRTLTLKEVTNGTQRLYEAEADAEAQYHLQDVIVSFVAGSFVTFALLFVGMRAIRKPRANVRSELIVAAE